MTHGEEGKNMVALEVDKRYLIPGEASPPGVEKPKGFSSCLGPPAPGSLLKNQGVFSTPPHRGMHQNATGFWYHLAAV